MAGVGGVNRTGSSVTNPFCNESGQMIQVTVCPSPNPLRGRFDFALPVPGLYQPPNARAVKCDIPDCDHIQIIVQYSHGKERFN